MTTEMEFAELTKITPRVSRGSTSITAADNTNYEHQKCQQSALNQRDKCFQCPNCTSCPDCVDFQKVAELKDAGLVIYRHTLRLENAVKAAARSPKEATAERTPEPGSDTKAADDNTNDVFILQNIKDVEITSSDFMPQFESKSVSCQRCRELLARAQTYLGRVSALDSLDVKAVCVHCKTKQFRGTCFICDKIVKKFMEAKGKRGQEEEKSKRRVQLFLGKMHNLLQSTVESETTREQGKQSLPGEILENLNAKGQKEIYIHEPDVNEFLVELDRPGIELLSHGPASLEKVTSAIEKQNIEKVKIQETHEVFKDIPNDSMDLASLTSTELLAIRRRGVSLGSEKDLIALKRKLVQPDYTERRIKPSLVQPHVEKKDHLSLRKYHSDESLITSFSAITEEIMKKHLKYFFPQSKQEQQKIVISSSELISKTQHRLSLEAEEKKKKQDEILKKKREEEKIKKIDREEKKQAEKEEKEKRKLRTRQEIRRRSKGSSSDELTKITRKLKKLGREASDIESTYQADEKTDQKVKKQKRRRVSSVSLEEGRKKIIKASKSEERRIKKEHEDLEDKSKRKEERVLEKEKQDKDKGEKGKTKDDRKLDEKTKGKEPMERVKKEKEEKERSRKDEKERVEKEKMERAREKKEEPEKLAKDKEEKEKPKKEEKEKLAKDKEEKGRIEKEEKDKIGRAKEEKEKVGKEKAESKNDKVSEVKGKVKEDKEMETGAKGKERKSQEDKVTMVKEKPIKPEKEKSKNQEEKVTMVKEKPIKPEKEKSKSPEEKVTMVKEKAIKPEKEKSKSPEEKVTMVKEKAIKPEKEKSKSPEEKVTMVKEKAIKPEKEKTMPKDIDKLTKKQQFPEKAPEISQENEPREKQIERKASVQIEKEIEGKEQGSTKTGQEKDKTKQAGSGKEKQAKSTAVTAKSVKRDEKKSAPNQPELGKVQKGEIELLNKVLANQEKGKAEDAKSRKTVEDELKKAQKAADQLVKTAGEVKPVKAAVAVMKEKPTSVLEEKRPAPSTQKTLQKDVDIKNIKPLKSQDDLILKLVKVKRDETVIKAPSIKGLPQIPVRTKPRKTKAIIAADDISEMELDLESMMNKKKKPDEEEIDDIIIGTEIRHKKNIHVKPPSDKMPALFKTAFIEAGVINDGDLLNPVDVEKAAKASDEGTLKGIIRYSLSDRTFIEKGWTMLPTEKVVRKMNIYRMRPSQPEFDWFEHNKSKGYMKYDTGQKLAEFDDNGRGRWYYRNGKLALDYYDCEEINAQQRFIIYSSGEPDERGRTRPITVLGMFDYNGNGVVFDHTGKIRLKYNQSEGVVLDRGIGPVSHWKWHSLNDPPVLQQVMIDTHVSYKDPEILKLGTPGEDKTRPENEEMLAIEFDNFIKEKSKKSAQKFKPFQIRMKALKINENFSLRVLDQASIYLIYRDGTTNLKLNLGMLLDHHEIVDTDTAELGEVANNLEKLPGKTDSIIELQKYLANSKRFDRVRLEHDSHFITSIPTASVDKLRAPISRPIQPSLRTVPSNHNHQHTNGNACKCRKPSTNTLYYDTRLI